jgi:hypothetical protein
VKSDLPLRKEHTVDEGIRIVLEYSLKYLPPFLRRRVRFLAALEHHSELRGELILELGIGGLAILKTFATEEIR